MRAMIRPTSLALLLVMASSTAVGQEATAQDVGVVDGDTLLIERIAEKPANLPTRGMGMAQVEARFGAPTERLDPRGGQRQQWPAINRWVYPNFTVYFERSKVIDVVMTKASADEIGPKPPAR
jgi:hypothetical protein